MRLKSKFLTVLTLLLFFTSIVIFTNSPVNSKQSDVVTKIKVVAKGADIHIAGGDTSIKGKLLFDAVSGEALEGDIHFKIKIFDDANILIYSLEGFLEGGSVMILPTFYSTVFGVTWTNLWRIYGNGLINSTDTDLTIDFRGQTITLPNTHMELVSSPIVMLVSPYGEYIGGISEDGGWAYAGITGLFGGTTRLTNYDEK